MMLYACILGLMASSAMAGFSYPSTMPMEVEKLWRSTNPSIRWDETNFLVDEAGPFAECKKKGVNGEFDVNPRGSGSNFGQPGNQQDEIGGYSTDVTTSGTTVGGVTSDILKVMRDWQRDEPFRTQIQRGRTFGCSVQPGCESGRFNDDTRRTVIACLFTPKFSRFGGFSGDDAKAHADTPIPHSIIFTSTEYDILTAELMFVNQNINVIPLDKLEYLSRYVTDCSLSKTSTAMSLRLRRLSEVHTISTELIADFTTKTGDTNEDIRFIISKMLGNLKVQELFGKTKKIGCSVNDSCPNNEVVVACVATTTV